MTKLYLLSKTIHRLFLYLISYMIIFMSVTGVILKYSFFSDRAYIDLGLIRYLHNEFSIYFAVSLGIMMLTGIMMYLFPLIRRKPSSKPITTTPQTINDS